MAKSKSDKKEMCCCVPGRFPAFAVILLLIGVFWLLKDLGILVVDIPFWPLTVIVVALSWIMNHPGK